MAGARAGECEHGWPVDAITTEDGWTEERPGPKCSECPSGVVLHRFKKHPSPSEEASS